MTLGFFGSFTIDVGVFAEQMLGGTVFVGTNAKRRLSEKEKNPARGPSALKGWELDQGLEKKGCTGSLCWILWKRPWEA